MKKHIKFVWLDPKTGKNFEETMFATEAEVVAHAEKNFAKGLECLYCGEAK